ncbi:MotB family protein [Methylobacterium sp. J-068]|uniref:MotB family protein n=1 Tax=Methylobacterium sp. J-068 TaxID=2836649 RepID=UPI001FB99634|nr:MotB family protein [Methylobacterium sp. J-068]MCJ2036249.1 MotB family protein [Methylobacterium sp. J-068]
MADEGHHEIIIIKRHGDHEEGHHGGAWKIALADFMTAMMALFLVLWLIGSTTKETKTAIAEYFNPVKLADVTFDRKGLRDPQNKPGEPTPEEGKPDAGKGEGSAEGKGSGKDDGKGAAGPPGSRAREAALFQDPYAVLAKLAAEAEPGPEVASADAVATETGEPGIKGGEAARDPFDPLYWQVAPLAKTRTEQAGSTGTVTPLPREARPDVRAATPGARPAPLRVASALPGETDIKILATPQKPDPTPKPEAGPGAKEKSASDAKASADTSAQEAKAADVKTAEAKATETKAAADAAETAAMAEIKAEIARVLPTQANAPAPRAEVRRTGEGILISLTDEVNFSMFGVGSAEPQAKVVRALEQVARILKDRPGRIVVRGHTDARPFRSETYDNWRLSSARAQMASYMLVRGGVADARLERIEGYADRQPRNPADPKAAENRRIEILLRGRPE